MDDTNLYILNGGEPQRRHQVCGQSSCKTSGPAPRHGKVLLKKLKRGTRVNQIGIKGLYARVRLGNKTGWISKLYLSAYKPGGKVSFSKSISTNSARRARRRGSNRSETAAVRGLKESEKLRTRGKKTSLRFCKRGIS